MTGTMFVARDPPTRNCASGWRRASRCRTTSRTIRLLRRARRDARRLRLRRVGPTTAGRMDSFVDQFQAAAARW